MLSQNGNRLEGYVAAGNISPVGIYTWNTGSLAWEKQVPISASGGGGAVTLADGADVAEGTKADVAYVTGSGTVIAILKGIFGKFGTLGQKTMAGSAPVVIASDQSALPVTGTFFQATQPVSIAASVAVTGPLTDVQLRASAVPVTAIVTSEVPGTGTTNLGKAEDAAAVSGDTGVLALFVRNDTEANQTSADLDYGAPAVDVAGRVRTRELSNLIATALSAANAGVTLTIAAAGAGLFHYITSIEIVNVNPTAAAIAAAAVTLAYTSTNIPGAPAWTAGNLLAAGAEKVVERMAFPGGIKTTTANTATTFVAPAIGAGGLCRIIVTYYIAP